MSNSTISVEYKTQKKYCPCCYQKLVNAEVSKVRTMELDKESALSWAPWKEIAEYPEDMESLVPDYVYETISFFAADSHEKIIIEESEIEKVRSWILTHVVAQFEDLAK